MLLDLAIKKAAIIFFPPQPPIIVLNVVVLEAKDLEAKDSDGFSDPYCMLGIKPGIKHLTASRASSTPQHSPKMQADRRRYVRTVLDKDLI